MSVLPENISRNGDRRRKGSNVIQSVSMIGMGALGLLFGQYMAAFLPEDKFAFVMDHARWERHRKDEYTTNGKPVRFRMVPADEVKEPSDLVFVGVKSPELPAAMETMAPCVGENTTIISLMNGISSEKILAERFGEEHVLYEASQEMDAQRTGTDLVYTRAGRIFVGVPEGFDVHTQEILMRRLDEVCAFFEQSSVPYVREQDILYRQWSKWMLNVGCNQVCMVFDAGYGPCMEEGSEAFAMMTGAMREVIALAQKKGIAIGEKELDEYLAILRTLDPNAVPSMGQDRRNGKLSEVELFAGTVLKLGRELDIETPVNAWLLRRVNEIEAPLREKSHT